MVRKLITIDEVQDEAIKPYLKEDGLTLSGFIRREIGKYLKEKREANIRDALEGRR